MGMYTELHLNAALKEDTPQAILDVLRFMVGAEDTEPVMIPNHALFSKGRWRMMLNCDSAYFDAPTRSEVIRNVRHGYTTLSVRCNLKNYEDEIETFLDWIDPWLAKEPGEFLGFYRYEESEQPTLIFKQDPVPAPPVPLSREGDR